MHVEPAISYVLGQGFRVHFSEILAAYSFLLVPWIHIAGFSIRTIRSLNIIFVAAALGTLWSAVKRFGIISKPAYRVLLLLLLMTEFGMIVSYRLGRYDGFGMFLLVLLFWCLSIENARVRRFVLFAMSLFLFWAGPQYLPVLFALGVVLLIFFARRSWKEVVACFIGGALGVMAFWITVARTGRLGSYLKFVQFQHQQSAAFLASFIRDGKFKHSNFIPKDFSLPFLLASAILLTISLRKQGDPHKQSALLFALTYTFLLGGLLVVTSKFPTYYSYMVVIPCTVAVCSALSIHPATTKKKLAFLLCGISGLVGVGLNTAAFTFDWRDRNYANVEGFVGKALHPNETVFVDVAAYFAARTRARDLYFQLSDWNVFPLMSEGEKESVSIIIVRPEDVRATAEGLGGAWIETGEHLTPFRKNLFDHKGLGFLSNADNDLVVYRRVSSADNASNLDHHAGL